VLESREVADAESDYLAALVQFDLQKTLFEREQTLWAQKISAEQQFLRARNAFRESELRVNVSRQKLSALDLTEQEIANLPTQSLTALRHKDIRAPISGLIVERRVDLGTPVGGEGQEKELYVIADLSGVWIELSVSTADLPSIRAAQPVAIASGPDGAQVQGRIVFVSPFLNPETRSARVIASLDNKDMAFRPGSFVTAAITIEERAADLVVPRAALQTIAGEQVVFVRTEEGFEKREVVVGRTDDRNAEIVFGLDAGETIAVTNTFTLKAELGKNEADHGHAH
jgi:membrane fusion protein, heavy metal efflux system